MNNRQRINEIIELFARHYPVIGTALHYQNPFQLLVAVMLSAQSTDKQVNKVTETLFKKYRNPEDFAALTPAILAEAIKGCGLYRTKSKHIIETSKLIVAKHNGKVPDNMTELLRLPGVGRKTANVILSTAFGKQAIAVDTHVFRVAARLGLARGKNPAETELLLKKAIPACFWSPMHHWLIYLGRSYCKARKPQCSHCIMVSHCPGKESFTSSLEKRVPYDGNNS